LVFIQEDNEFSTGPYKLSSTPIMRQARAVVASMFALLWTGS